MHHLPTHPTLLHPRTGEPLRAIGLVGGKVIWPIMGGDGTEDDANDEVVKDDDADTVDDGDDSGDKLAPEDDPDSIEYWKKRSRQNERDARKAKRERDAALSSKPGNKADDADKPDLDKIREDAKAEATREVLHGRVEDKIEAKAHAFSDPEDAVAILLRSYEIDDFLDGDKIDVEAIAEALTELGEKKPNLLAQGGKKFQGSADGGARKDAPPARPKDLGEALARHYDKR